MCSLVLGTKQAHRFTCSLLCVVVRRSAQTRCLPKRLGARHLLPAHSWPPRHNTVSSEYQVFDLTGNSRHTQARTPTPKPRRTRAHARNILRHCPYTHTHRDFTRTHEERVQRTGRPTDRPANQPNPVKQPRPPPSTHQQSGEPTCKINNDAAPHEHRCGMRA